MLSKICLAVLWLGSVVAEPPVNNGYLPPSNGYNYPAPNVPFPPAPQPQPTRPPVFNQPPSPPRPVPTYGPPAPRPPPRPVPTYGPPAPRPPPRPVPTYGPPAPRPPPRPVPTYGPPAPRPPAPRPQPTYGPPGASPPISGIGYQPGQNPRPVQNENDVYNNPGDHDHHHHMPGMPFDFNYAVKDDYYGTDYSHNAISDGDVVKGEYRVLLPDGRLQIVTYTADWKNGFNADVKYQGEPQYPQQQQGGNNVLASPQGPSRQPQSGPY